MADRTSELVDVVDALLDHSWPLAETCQSDTFVGRCLLNLSCRLLQDILGFLVAVKLSQQSTNPEHLIATEGPHNFVSIMSSGSLENLSTIKFLRSGLNKCRPQKKWRVC